MATTNSSCPAPSPPPRADTALSFTIAAAHNEEAANPSIASALYSVRGELAGATVVLTGATGYVGSLVLEQLLRTTDVRKVVCLLRGRRGAPAADRLRAALGGPLFHLLRGRPALAQKAVAVQADMDAPGLGLSTEDRAAVVREAEVFIHCAADIRLEVDVQTTLRANYGGTKKVLELVSEAYDGGKGSLRAFVHVSSAFVNMNRPRGSAVAERIYLMRHDGGASGGRGAGGAGGANGANGDEAATAGPSTFCPPSSSSYSGATASAFAAFAAQEASAPTSAGPLRDAVDCERLVAELMALEPSGAEARAETLCSLWSFANNYALGKHLAEQLVARMYRRGGLLPPQGTVIVRPSLVAAVAQAPHPGYCGNFAGPIGGVAAMVTGLYGPLDGIASKPLGVWDIVPGDVVASVIVASAAAASAGAAGTIARAAQAAREGRCDSVGEALAEAAAAACGGGGGSSSGIGSAANSALPTPLGSSGSAAPPASAASSSSFSRRSLAAKLLSAATTAAAAAGDGSPVGSRPESPGGGDAADDGQPPAAPARGGALARLYSTTSLSPLGGGGGGTRNNSCADLSARVGAARPPSISVANNSNSKLLIVHACTSSTYPITLMENWNAAAEFITAHPPPFSLRGRKSVIPRMSPAFEPSLERVRATDKKTGAKVNALCALLRLFGDHRGANKLSAGFASIVVQNNGRTDRSLTFETHGLLALEAALQAEERPQRMLVWRPGPAPSDVLALSASYRAAAPAAEEGEGGAGAGASADASSAAPAPVVPPRDLPPVSWRQFLLTQAAGVYGTMFRRAVPREVDAAAELRRRQRQAWWRKPLGVAGAPESWSAKRVASGQAVVDGAWGAASSMGVVRHDFVLVKPLKTQQAQQA